MKKVQFNNSFSPVMFILPQLIVIVIFLYLPILQTFRDAFTIQDPFGFSRQFAWFDNFIFAVNDPSYWAALKFTLIYIFSITFITVLLGLLLAV